MSEFYLNKISHRNSPIIKTFPGLHLGLWIKIMSLAICRARPLSKDVVRELVFSAENISIQSGLPDRLQVFHRG